MRSFQIISLPIKLVIHDFSKAFDVPFREHCNEYNVDIPDHLGKGYIRGTDFRDGLAYIEYNCLFHEDIEIRFTLDKTHPLKFIYSSRGEIYHSFHRDREWSKADLYKYLIVASSKTNDHILRIRGGHWIRIHSVEIERVAFFSKIHTYLMEVNEQIIRLFSDVHADNEFHHSGSYGLNLVDIIQDINERAFRGFVKILHLEAKSLEILSQHVLEFDNSFIENAPAMRPGDLEKVKRAAELIQQRLHDAPTISHMAQEVGLNKNKLHTLFKQLYKQSVHQYLLDLRLEEAKNLLQSTDLPIAEVSERIGYSNSSHFSRIFFDRYGIQPKALRKMLNKNGKAQ